MITSLLVALIVIAIVCIIGWVIVSIIPGPPQLKVIIWAVVAIICLIVLLGAVTGKGVGLTL